jgi:hypothetical protein
MMSLLQKWTNTRSLPNQLGNRHADLYVVDVHIHQVSKSYRKHSSKKFSSQLVVGDDQLPEPDVHTLLFGVLSTVYDPNIGQSHYLHFFGSKRKYIEGADPIYWFCIPDHCRLEDFEKGKNPECLKLKTGNFSVVLRLVTREEKVLWLHTLNYLMHTKREAQAQEDRMSHSIKDLNESRKESVAFSDSGYKQSVSRTEPKLYAEISLGMFNENNPIRRGCLSVVNSAWFAVVMTVSFVPLARDDLISSGLWSSRRTVVWHSTLGL